MPASSAFDCRLVTAVVHAPCAGRRDHEAAIDQQATTVESVGRRPTVTGRTPRRVGTATVVRSSVGQQLIQGVDRAATTRWGAARERAAEFEGPRDEQVAAVTARIRRELGLAGAASGGAAAVPGVGLVTVTTAFAVELGWSTVRLTDLIMTIAAIHGHDRATFEERRMWVLSILAYREGAAGVLAKLVAEFAEAPGRRGARRLSQRSIQKVNAAIARVVVRRYGTRAGVAAIGRAVPFGVGAAIGYGINSRAVGMVSDHAHAFFTEFPIALDAIDVEPL